jgi:DNA-binding NarL/FixJ family response regulator
VHVVIAAENPSLRLALELLLSEESGVEVVATTDRSDCLLALVNLRQPDLIVLDWMLPGQPILDVMALLRAIEERPKLIVISTEAGIYRQALESGANAFVVIGDSPNHFLETFHVITGIERLKLPEGK